MLLVLTSCSGTKEKIVECYGTYTNTEKDQYIEEYYRFYVDEDGETVNQYEAMYNYHFKEPMSIEDNEANAKYRESIIEDIKGTSYEVHLGSYLVQEKIIFDYTKADFAQLYDEGFIYGEQENVIPEYMSLTLLLEDYNDYNCQTFIDNDKSHLSQLIVPFDGDYDRDTYNPDLFK